MSTGQNFLAFPLLLHSKTSSERQLLAEKVIPRNINGGARQGYSQQGALQVVPSTDYDVPPTNFYACNQFLQNQHQCNIFPVSIVPQFSMVDCSALKISKYRSQSAKTPIRTSNLRTIPSLL